MGIVVIGATFVDIKGFPNDTYLPTGRNVGRIEYIHGGVARNLVEDIANVELRPTFISIVDTTPLGTDVLQKLINHKVNVDYVQRIPDGMGTWLAVFDNNGDVAGSISKRPNMLPVLKLLEDRGDEIFSQADSAVIEVDIDKDIVKTVLDLCEKHGKKVFGLVSNMSIAAKRRDLLRRYTCFICNQQEAGQLFLDDYSQKTPEEMRDILADRLPKAEIPSMVVTMGGQGAVYADLQGNKGICPARKVQVQDTTGAGDAFCAGVLCGAEHGEKLEDAIILGIASAAASLSEASATDGMRAKADCMKLYQELR